MSERESAYIPINDIAKAWEYEQKGTSPQVYYEKRWDGTINLAETLKEDEKIQWKEPQLILLGGLQRSGKTTVSGIIRDKFNNAGFECRVFNSDNTRDIIRKRDEALYEQILTKHIKVLNNFDDPKDFIRHVREDLFAEQVN